MRNVLVCGMAVADLVMQIPELPDQADKYLARNASLLLGGGGANAAVAVARLGLQPVLMGRCGDDWVAQLICSTLEREGVDCCGLSRTAGAESSISTVLIDQLGERQIINYRGKGLNSTPPAMHSLESEAGPFHAVLTDTRWPDAALQALTHAHQSGIPGVLDAEPVLDERLLEMASHIAFSKEGLVECSGDVDFKEPAAIAEALADVQGRYGGWVGVTNGADGSYFLRDKTIAETASTNAPAHDTRALLQHVGAFDVDVVDTLAAGDIWHGAFTAKLAGGEHDRIAVQFANAAAALKCTRAGGGQGAPDLHSVQEFLSERSS